MRRPLRPLRMNSVLSAAVLLHSVVLLWQTIISEMPEQRELLFTTTSPYPLKTVHAARHPLNVAHSVLCTNTQ